MELENCTFDDDALLDLQTDTWVKIDSGIATVGVTSTLSWLCGRLQSVVFKEEGIIYNRGKTIAAIEGPKHFATVKTPVSGKLIETNPKLRESPWILNKDPYNEGWVAKIRPINLATEAGYLKRPSEIKELLRDRLSSLKVKCYKEFPDVELFEIGVECSAVLVRLNDLITQLDDGSVIHIVSDDPTASIEMIRWTDQTGQSLVQSFKEDSIYHFIVKKVKQ
ncbi:MAG: sulfurtransferase TusA family protein [Nitrososphaerota archaeon]